MSEDIKNKEILEEEQEEAKEEVRDEVINEDEDVVEGELEEKDDETDKVSELEEEVKKWKDLYVRKVAEFDNIRKRLERDKNEFIKYASEKIIIKLLDSVDNLDRGIESSKTSKDFDSLVKGVEMTLNQMHKILSDEGVEEIESLGKEFDPYEHHAMMQEESEEYKPNHVMQVLQKGYRMKGKIIRPALVKVAKK